MSKIGDFFRGKIVGIIAGVMAVIGLVEQIFKVLSNIHNHSISVWVIILAIGSTILLFQLYKYCRIRYFIKNFTKGSFGGSRTYAWEWVKVPKDSAFNVYGYFPSNINVKPIPILDPNIKVYVFSYCITDKDLYNGQFI